MKLIDQKSTIWGECPTEINEAILWLEQAGRVCYRSEDKIVEGSGSTFVANVIKRGHGAVLETSNLVVRVYGSHIFQSKYLNETYQYGRFVGGNFRAWIEELGTKLKTNSIKSLFDYIDEAPGFVLVDDKSEIPYPLKRVAVKLTTDRAVTHELVRHRPCSFLQESQRYVSYKDEVEFINQWYEFDITELAALEECEQCYQHSIKSGRRPEQARFILPNITATTIIVTATILEWELIFGLRCAPSAYRQMQNLMTSVRDDFSYTGLIR